jgi:MATE family multidrug resistance protein
VPLFLEGASGIASQLVATAAVARLARPRAAAELALSSLVLAQTQLNVGASLLSGMAAAMETCCGQAYGAGEYALLGLVLRCARLLCLAVAVPASAVWAAGLGAPLLRALGQPPDVSEAAGALLRRLWPVLPLLAVTETTAQCAIVFFAVC